MFKIMAIATSAMEAQMVRMNTTASNLANADVVAGSEAEAYRAKKPVFKTLFEQQLSNDYQAQVSVTKIAELNRPNLKRYEPQNPLANEEGYVYSSNVNSIEEMVEMTSASRSYQTNVEVINTTKELLFNTLRMGQ